MTTTLPTRQVIDHLFLLTLLSSQKAERGRLLEKTIALAGEQLDKDKTYEVEIRVNGVELDFRDFTDKVRDQLEELVMGAARRLLDEQFANRFQAIAQKISEAEQHAGDLRNALEDEARKAYGMPPRQDED